MSESLKEKCYFFLNNGETLKDIKELHKSLTKMDDSVFNHHVNQERNDFSNWIRNVHKNESLAEKILSMKSKEELKNCLKDHLGSNNPKKESSKKYGPVKIKVIPTFQASKDSIISQIKSVFK